MISPVHRIATTCMALSATAMLMPGCGGSGRASSGNANTPVTKAQAAAYADAVNLREADLGWERVRSGGVEKVSRADVVFAHCYRGVDPHRWVVLTYSTRYGKTGDASAGSMQSNVLVMPTAALAAEDAKAMLSARGFACFAHEQAPATIRTASGKVIRRGRGTVTRLASPLPGVADSFEWRTTWTRVLPVQRPRRLHISFTLSSYADVLGFLAGPAEVELTSFSVEKPLPIATELQALMAIYKRAEEHKLGAQT
jgi:hypothetical protein